MEFEDLVDDLECTSQEKVEKLLLHSFQAKRKEKIEVKQIFKNKARPRVPGFDLCQFQYCCLFFFGFVFVNCVGFQTF